MQATSKAILHPNRINLVNSGEPMNEPMSDSALLIKLRPNEVIKFYFSSLFGITFDLPCSASKVWNPKFTLGKRKVSRLLKILQAIC